VSQPRIAVFARSADGSLQPKRVISGQGSRLGRTVHGLAYDPVHDEIVVPNPLAAAILVFRGDATGDAAPIRIIQGPRTRLQNPHSVNLDPAHDEILVGDLRADSVLVFPREAQGDVPPVRALCGTRTRLDHVTGLAVDPATDLLAVAAAKEVLIFRRTDDGDVPPRASIEGPRTGIGHEPWQLQVHGGRIFLAASNHLHQWAYQGGDHPLPEFKEVPPDPWHDPTPGFIGVWNVTDDGDRPPLFTIGGAASGLFHPTGLAFAVDKGELFVSDSVTNSVSTFRVPQLFAAPRESNRP
jgi:hypothetical protein